MIVRTEFSFRTAFGSVEAAQARLPLGGVIADDGCWGHVPWAKAAAKAGKRWGLGARVRVGGKKTDWREVILVPRTDPGLRELYRLVTLAAAQEGRLREGQLEASPELCLVAAPARSGEAPALPKGSLVPFAPGLLRGREHPLVGWPFTDRYDEDELTQANGRVSWRADNGAYLDAALGVNLHAAGGFYGPRFTGTVRVGKEWKR